MRRVMCVIVLCKQCPYEFLEFKKRKVFHREKNYKYFKIKEF